jgi:hypothetical protein
MIDWNGMLGTNEQSPRLNVNSVHCKKAVELSDIPSDEE